ncbi:MAG: ATP-binding protein [Planctomycetes bacterium]|nr:ATP-binding protein [Planctomycetota bacterium]
MTFEPVALLRSLFDRSPVGIALTGGPRHVVLGANLALARALGRPAPAEGVVGLELPACLPAGADPLRRTLDEALEGDPRPRPVVTEHRLGGVGLVALRWCVYRAEARPADLVVKCWDLTEEVGRRHRDEAIARELREANERLRAETRAREALAEEAARHAAQLDALLEGMTEGVVVADAAGRLVLVNRVAREALGWETRTLDDLRRADMREVDGTPLPFERWPLVRAIRGERFSGVELVYVSPLGEQRRVVFAGCAVGASERERLAMILVRDVTDLRRLEAERDEALALISHDLRTPIGTIALRAEVLQRTLLERGEAELARAAGQVLQGARRIGAMADALSAASDPQAVARLDLAPVDLLSVVSDAVEHTVPPAARARVVVERQDELPPVRVDPERIERAVANMAANALKYSPPDAPVRVRLRRVDGEVIVSVEDRGVGIPPDELPRLFEKSFRARTAGGVEGLGLGLYIVRRIAEAHGGRVWAESRVGQGSTFHLALPVQRA